MERLRNCVFSWILVIFTWHAGAVLAAAGGADAAVEVGKPAPDFNLPATTGVNVSLKDFRGKSWVLVEFYGADFVPT